MQAGGRRFDPDRLHHSAWCLGVVLRRDVWPEASGCPIGIAVKPRVSICPVCSSPGGVGQGGGSFVPLLGGVVLCYCESGSGASLGAPLVGDPRERVPTSPLWRELGQGDREV